MRTPSKYIWADRDLTALSNPRAIPTRQIYKPRYARRAFGPPRFARNKDKSVLVENRSLVNFIRDSRGVFPISHILLVRISMTSFPAFTLLFVPREARRAEGPPSVARFINLSRGDRARIAKGGQISICPYIFRWCPHSCLATKPNRDR